MLRQYIRILALASISLAVFSSTLLAQDDDMEEFRKKMNESYTRFAEDTRTEYAGFREQLNKEYEDFMRAHPWTPVEVAEPLRAPHQPEPAPPVEPEDQQGKPAQESRPIVIDKVIPTEPTAARPQPFEEIEETPQPIQSSKQKKSLTVTFYGTEMQLRPVNLSKFKINGRSEKDFANGWGALAGKHTNNLIIDCLKVRDEYRLPDWGYMKFLDQLAGQLTSPGSNEQVMLLGFLLNQSGYKIRYAYDHDRNLLLMFSTKGMLFDTPRLHLDGDRYFAYNKPQGKEIFVCNFGMPKEQAVNMGIDREPLLAYKPGTTREIVPKNNEEYKFTLTPNKNLIDFYGDYPEATLGEDPHSFWLIHLNTPASREVREQLYPDLRKAVEGKSQLEAVQFLLKVAQTFPYEFDEEIWGRDRAFWMEESWEYPFSDCEDHSVNFAHMVRDVLGLDVCMIYYPGHCSNCVAITDEDVRGDYIEYEGKRYYVCDPTYFYAGVGKTAPGNNNAEAVLLPVR